MKPVVIVVSGVSGTGKSTVGAAVAEELGWDFFDADDFHPPANVEKMRRGVPLDDADREPWLDRLHQLVTERVDRADPAVLACSALKRSYRDRLRRGKDPAAVRFVHLHADRDTLARRLSARTGHYMPASLLDSQLATLERPTEDEGAIVVDTSTDGVVPVDEVLAELG